MAKHFKPRSEAADERRQRRIKVFMAVVIVLLLVLSSAAYVVVYFTSGSTSSSYNGVKIRPVVDANGLIQGYSAKIDGKVIPFYSQPADSLDLTLPSGMIETMKSSQAVVFLFDPTSNQTTYYDQIRFDMQQYVSIQQGAAVTKPSDIYNFPVLSCANATQGYQFLLLQEGEKNISYSNGCYVLSGNTIDLLLIRDRIIYAYYGVTQ